MKKRFKLIISLIFPILVGIAGSVFTTGSINSGWYAELQKPSFTPPNFVFGPVWTTLYLLMGFAFYLIWLKPKNRNFKIAKYIYFIQLILNFLWSILFFGLQNPTYAAYDISVLFIFILLNIFYFYKIEKLAGILLIPYLLWVTYASVLNFTIVFLN